MEEVSGIDSLLRQVSLSGLIWGGLGCFLAFKLSNLIGGVFARLGDRFVDRRLFFQQVSTILQLLLVVTGIAGLGMATFDLDDETAAMLSGGFGVGLGLALKDLASAVVAGFTVLSEKPFQVGDRIAIGDTYGDVVSIGLRSVRVNTLDDNLVTIPNNTFLSEKVASANAGELIMLVQMDFFIDIEADIEKAVAIAEECMTTSKYCYLEKPWVVLVTQMNFQAYPAIRIRCKSYVIDVKYEKPFESDVTRMIMKSYKEAGILMPRAYEASHNYIHPEE